MVACLWNTKHCDKLQEHRSMSQSPQLSSDQLTEIIQDEKTTNRGAREVQEQVEDGEEVHNPDDTSSVLNAVLNTINNGVEPVCLDEAVSLLNPQPIRELEADRVPCKTLSLPGLPKIKFLVHQVWAIWFIVRRWVGDLDIPGVLVADEMGLAKTFTMLAVPMIFKLLTETVVMGLLLSIVCRNTRQVLVNMAHSDNVWRIGEQRDRDPLQRLNFVPCRLLAIHTTQPQWHAVLTSAIEPILVVTMATVADRFKSDINDMTSGTNFVLVNLLQAVNACLTHEDLNTWIDEPKIQCSTRLVSYDTWTSSVKPSINGQL